MKLHHIQLAIPPGSEDECRQFYCAILGWKELPKPTALAARDGLWLSAGEVELHLGVEKHFRPARKAHPAFLVAGIENIAASLEDQKFEVSPSAALSVTATLHEHRLRFLSAPSRWLSVDLDQGLTVQILSP